MKLSSGPSPNELGFVESLNLGVIDKIVWLLLAAFVVLGFFDTLTTLIAYSTVGGFYELNWFASALFGLGFRGFLLAEAVKFLPVIPLAYMAALRTTGTSADFQVSLLKIAALAVLTVGDAFLSWVVLVNNLPSLIGLV